MNDFECKRKCIPLTYLWISFSFRSNRPSEPYLWINTWWNGCIEIFFGVRLLLSETFGIFEVLIKAKFVVASDCIEFNWNEIRRCFRWFFHSSLSLALFDSFSRSFKTIVPENFPHVSCSRHLLLFHFSSFNQLKLKILFGFGGKSHRWHGCSCHCLWIHKIWSNYVNSIYSVTPRDWRYSWRRYIFIVHAIAVIVKWKSEGTKQDEKATTYWKMFVVNGRNMMNEKDETLNEWNGFIPFYNYITITTTKESWEWKWALF